MASSQTPPRPYCAAIRPASSGPMATPRLPPTEKTDIAVERRSPESQAANLLASGWNAATPRLDASTHRSASSNVWANASSPMPTPASAGPATSSQSPRRLSKRWPKNGCTTDDATVAASMIAAVRV